MSNLDLKKAFDSLKWDVILATLQGMGFFSLRNLISNCIKSASFSVMIEGSPTRPFKNQRGLRQGAPIPLILFNLVMDMLSRLVLKEVVEKRMDIYMVNGARSVSHLIYADE